MVTPVRPEAYTRLPAPELPDSVIEVVNKLIHVNFYGRSSEVKQEDIVKYLVSDFGLEKSSIEEHIPMIPDVYRAYGWDVTYNFPYYQESGTAKLTFYAPTYATI